MAGQVHRVGIKSLPITRASLNGYLVGNCLLDSGSEKSLVNASVMRVIAPAMELGQPCSLISASGHKLRALGTCSLSVRVESAEGLLSLPLWRDWAMTVFLDGTFCS